MAQQYTAETANAPLVSFVVPCYNSAAYMQRCIDSLLVANRPCEIIIVNDGSSDNTLAIANNYAAHYGNIVVIDQPNKGWGGGVNAALAVARGLYFKVVDSDDWIESLALHRVLYTLDALVQTNQTPDLLFTNYVYDHTVDESTHTMHYRNMFPEGRVFAWNEARQASVSQQLMLHATWYLTPLLRESGVKLPEHMAYMDSLFMLYPLPYVQKLYYLDIDAYHYMVGRQDQSVNIEVVKAHIDEQLYATQCVIDSYNYEELLRLEPNMALTLSRYVSMMLCVSTVHLFMIGTPEAIEKNARMWAYLKQNAPTLYASVRMSPAGLANRKTKGGRLSTCFVYGITRSIFKFS